MTDTHRTTERDRKNESSHRPPSRFEPDHQRGDPQNDFDSDREDDRGTFDGRGRGRRRSSGYSDRFDPGSTVEASGEGTRLGVGYGDPSNPSDSRRSTHDDATNPDYWRERADRFRRFDPQDPGRQRSGGDAQWDRDFGRGEDFGYGDGQRSADFGRHANWTRLGGFQHAPDGRESHAGKGPKGYRRSDERITEDINQCLMDDHRIDASEIEVKVQDGEVSLTGTVSDRRCRRAVEDLVESVAGVTDVSNQLKVQRGQAIEAERGSSRSESNPAATSSIASRSSGKNGA